MTAPDDQPALLDAPPESARAIAARRSARGLSGKRAQAGLDGFGLFDWQNSRALSLQADIFHNPEVKEQT